VPFFTVDAVSIYYGLPLLNRLWHSYAMLLHGTSRVGRFLHMGIAPIVHYFTNLLSVQFASTYMVVCATAERFVVVADVGCLSCMSRERGRTVTIGVTLLLVLLLRVPAFMDYSIERKQECPAFQDFSFAPWLMAREDYVLYNFYVLCFLHILIPFLLLLSLNLLVVAMMRRKINQQGKFATSSQRKDRHLPQLSWLLRKESIYSVSRQQRNELRYATRTMVMITFTYLVCNMFNCVITVMENAFKDDGWMVNEDGTSTKFYTYTADLISERSYFTLQVY
jgi:uncharacterized Tic20 family protein